jgi:hypothetical protein
VLLWRASAVDSVPVWYPGLTYPGLPYPRVRLGWVKDGSGNPVLVPGLRCKEDNVDAGMTVMPTVPSIEPFISLASTYPDYAPGATAKMCVAQEGSTSVGVDTVVGSPTYGKALIQYWHKVIDDADGYVSYSD